MSQVLGPYLIGALTGAVTAFVVTPFIAYVTRLRGGPLLLLFQRQVLANLRQATDHVELGDPKSGYDFVLSRNGHRIFIEVKSWLRWSVPTIEVVTSSIRGLKTCCDGVTTHGFIVIPFGGWVSLFGRKPFGGLPRGIHLGSRKEMRVFIASLDQPNGVV